jgi:3-deoxy-manno-octulosonate cytidylyltransferase (CMP-KDO synthetase)
MESERFPGKPLARIGEGTLLSTTYEQAKQVQRADVFVLTDDPQIRLYCDEKSIPVVSSGPDCWCGTDRICSVLPIIQSFGYTTVVNWQVDEPMVDPKDIGKMLYENLNGVSTLYDEPDDYHWRIDENEVKAVRGRCDRLFWFTRTWIPSAVRHVGVYSFPVNILNFIYCRPQTDCSKQESLEQLTWLEYGVHVYGVRCSGEPRSVNTPEDLLYFHERKNDAN